ncbi:MAG: phosphoenolpyruvate carboxykinase (ATP) [Bacteriovoracaceae bacterium]
MNEKIYNQLGLKLDLKDRNIFFNYPNNFLVENSVKLGHGKLSKDGSLVVLTGKHTGRSAGDKYVVYSPETENKIWWENSIHKMTSQTFNKLKERVVNYLNTNDIFITERSVGAHDTHNMGVRVVTTHPHNALFANHLFRERQRELTEKDFTILHAPNLKIDPLEFDSKSETIITTCFETNTTIIVGTGYAGEIKKSMFCVMNYLLPDMDILPMHAGSNRTKDGDVSVFFGLSGTGKTTLSTDEGTYLIGDDEHGLSHEGVFNFEGGCYAKTYELSEEKEPGIYRASNRFGAICENVEMDEKSGVINFDSKVISENGRSSYPLDFIDGLEKSSRGELPKNMFFLCADAFGVLPPVAKLSKEQAMFYFVLGYTAKLAGTEIGVVEPSATFSTCFGAPFMLRHPKVYAELLGKYLDEYNINVWLINTGWSAGPYGKGFRFPLKTTREIIRSVQHNELKDVNTEKDPIFGLEIPQSVREISKETLIPNLCWEDQESYQVLAKELALKFHDQMKKFGDFYNENKKGAPTYGSDSLKKNNNASFLNA